MGAAVRNRNAALRFHSCRSVIVVDGRWENGDGNNSRVEGQCVDNLSCELSSCCRGFDMDRSLLPVLGHRRIRFVDGPP